MKMLFKNTITVLAILLLNVLGVASHARAMPMVSHEMNGMNHSMSSSMNCATLCRTAVFNKKETIDPDTAEENDVPFTPFYVGLQTYRLADVKASDSLYTVGIKPTPKVPIHILYGVFRS